MTVLSACKFDGPLCCCCYARVCAAAAAPSSSPSFIAPILVQGALTSIYLASSPEVEGVTSKYFDKCKPVPSTPITYDLDVAIKFWDISQELTAAKVKAAAAV